MPTIQEQLTTAQKNAMIDASTKEMLEKIAEKDVTKHDLTMLRLENEVIVNAEKATKKANATAKRLATAKIKREKIAEKVMLEKETLMSAEERVDSMSMSTILEFSDVVQKTFSRLEFDDYLVIIKQEKKARKIALRIKSNNTQQKFLLNFFRYILTDSVGNVTISKESYATRYFEFTSSVDNADNRDKSFVIGKIKASSSVFLVKASFSAIDSAIQESVRIQGILNEAQDSDSRYVKNLGTISKGKATVEKIDLSSLI